MYGDIFVVFFSIFLIGGLASLIFCLQHFPVVILLFYRFPDFGFHKCS